MGHDEGKHNRKTCARQSLARTSTPVYRVFYLDFYAEETILNLMNTPPEHTVTVTDSCRTRVEEVRKTKNSPGLKLRLAIEGGGCSGFQYVFSWEPSPAGEDRIFRECLVIDPASLPLLDGATVDFSRSLMGSKFTVSNPNAASGCGCGGSFSV
jgi:iron-sulfur cluster insertion protein